MSDRRLIEESFPLKEVSEHSKHEKNVRHGHISTLHIWPARRPLAACRAAIIAALMPDPGDEAGRHELNKKIASITKWKTENGPALDYFRQEIRKAYGGRAPKVLDMFAGGGAIPLEAMRLGCDVTAIDYNPVAWFILKCTLEFPQRLADKTWPLPTNETMRAKPKTRRPVDDDSYIDGEDDFEGEDSEDDDEAENGVHEQLELLSAVSEDQPTEGNVADHVRYWGGWVLEQARKELEPYYPTVDGQPTVAYLWARTVPCPDPKCGCEVPLLKTLWLCKKAEKSLPDTPENRMRPDFLRIKHTKNTSRVVINARRALKLIPPEHGKGGVVQYLVWTPSPQDKVPNGTMSGATAFCPSCGISLSPDYLKECGVKDRMRARMTSVVFDAGYGKEYRSPTFPEISAADYASRNLSSAANQIPYGIPDELQHKNPRTLITQLYGLNKWSDIFAPRQLLSLITFARLIRQVNTELQEHSYPHAWKTAIVGSLYCVFAKLLDYNSSLCSWYVSNEQITHQFNRYALPMTWDYAEAAILSMTSGGFPALLEYTMRAIQNLYGSSYADLLPPQVLNQSATSNLGIEETDLIVTDPPYYTAIPYADLSDFFYVWLRRIVGDQYPCVFDTIETPKSEELALRLPHEDIFDDHKPEWYEAGMARTFRLAWTALVPEGRMVIVFAHKEPEAWERLVTAMINVGFAVVSSWPIDTEMSNRTRAMNSAALASSIWLVCRKRQDNAGIGRYRAVRKAMEERVIERLRYFWDIGLSGPDFVWAAVGPALESYSSYNEVKRLDGSSFTVGDFLKEVRRIVADFALGQILKGQSTEGLDEWTRYYLIHRSNFGLNDAPVGECILLTQGYGLDLNELRSDRGYIRKGSGSDVRLAKWDERTRDDLGQPHPSGGLPMIDAIHHLMHLWGAGSLERFNQYVAEHGLRQNELFWAVGQAILEMADAKSRERTLLEAIVAWGRGKSPEETPRQESLLSDTS